jgi:hypothetical protein
MRFCVFGFPKPHQIFYKVMFSFDAVLCDAVSLKEITPKPHRFVRCGVQHRQNRKPHKTTRTTRTASNWI